jgi:hypothetical protein
LRKEYEQEEEDDSVFPIQENEKKCGSQPSKKKFNQLVALWQDYICLVIVCMRTRDLSVRKRE